VPFPCKPHLQGFATLVEDGQGRRLKAH